MTPQTKVGAKAKQKAQRPSRRGTKDKQERGRGEKQRPKCADVHSRRREGTGEEAKRNRRKG